MKNQKLMKRSIRIKKIINNNFYKISILILIFLIFIFFNFSIDERLNIAKNKIELINKGQVKLNGLNLTFISSSKEKLIIDGSVLNLEFNDWYGKDYILFEFKGKKEKHQFNTFKFKSWKKVNYKLSVDKNNDTIFFKWILKCKGIDTKKGVYTYFDNTPPVFYD